MSIICDKYGLEETQFKAMVKDGIISTTWPFYDEVVVFYKANRNKGNSEAVKMTAERFNVSIPTVYRIVKTIS